MFSRISQAFKKGRTFATSASKPANFSKVRAAGALGALLGVSAYYYASLPVDAEAKKKYHGVVIFGAPASGKGTQSELIVKKFGYVHMSSGDILRAEVSAQTPLGKEAKGFMDKGALVPDNLVIGMIKNKLLTPAVAQNGWLLDGMPRTQVQAKALDEMGCHPDLIISLEVPDSLLVERVCGRREDPVTKKIYHLKYNPPPADIVARLTQRSDDTEEKLKARLAGFHAHCGPIINYYRQHGDPILVLNGNRKPEEVFADINKKLSEK